jgi:hypothetical protein
MIRMSAICKSCGEEVASITVFPQYNKTVDWYHNVMGKHYGEKHPDPNQEDLWKDQKKN